VTELPEFRTVLRGYDPNEVSAAVTELSHSLTVARRTAAERTMELTRAQERESALNAELDEAVARLAAAERNEQAHTAGRVDVGPRISTILSLAEEEAGQLRADGERDAFEIRRAAEAEAARMKAAAAEAADTIVEQATQDAAATKQAGTALQAQVADAERRAADILEAARRDAVVEGRRVQAEFAEAERTRDEIHAHLGGVLDLLTTLDAELADDVKEPPPRRSSGRERASSRSSG
jgi:cell division septum initiation protein DivIVA